MRDDDVVKFVENMMGERRAIIDKAVEKYFPKSVGLNTITNFCGSPSYEYDIGALNDAIYKPGWELLGRGGKRWRPFFMMLVIESLGKNPENYLDFLVIPEVVHNGTLIIDDIEDDSLLRRGKPCVHKIFGVDIAINAGNTMYFNPLLSIIKNRNKYSPDLMLDLFEIYAQEMINISHGQGTDIYWHRGNRENVNVNQYLQMCAYKTGTLARMSAKIGAKLAGADEKIVIAFGKFAESTAVAFQIQDDVLNLQEKVGKEFGEDIKEGKRSLLVIRALDQLDRENAEKLREILNMHTSNLDLINEAIVIIKKTDAFDYAKTLAKKLIEDTWKELDPYLKQSRAKNELKMLADYLITRSR